MQKRIYYSMVALVLLCVAALAMLFGTLYVRALQQQEKAALRHRAHLAAALLNTPDTDPYLYIGSVGTGHTRVTLISAYGRTLYDSYGVTHAPLYRGDRAEFIQALRYGRGETLRGRTYYYAVLLHSGRVLRLSYGLSGTGDVLPGWLPALAGAVAVLWLLAYLLAARVTRDMVRPLMDANTTLRATDLYEELRPFAQKMEQQKQEIEDGVATLSNRAQTMAVMMRHMREGLVMLDMQGLVLDANHSAAALFGLRRPRDMGQKNIRHLYRDPAFGQAVAQCLAGQHSELAFARNHKQYMAFFNVVAGQGAIIFLQDVTAQHAAELQRRQFTANVSHELKTPLTTISGLAEMLHSGMARPEDVPGFAQKISNHATRLLHMINDILHLSALDEGHTDVATEDCDLYALAQATIAHLQEKAATRGVVLALHGDPTPAPVRGHARLLEELLHNLIDNAIIYNHDNGRVDITLGPGEGQVVLSVADTGIGIPAAHHPRLFERFYRVDASRSKSAAAGGTGLGLAIVKHIAELHHATVELHSEEGVGTTVVCRFGGGN